MSILVRPKRNQTGLQLPTEQYTTPPARRPDQRPHDHEPPDHIHGAQTSEGLSLNGGVGLNGQVAPSGGNMPRLNINMRIYLQMGNLSQ